MGSHVAELVGAGKTGKNHPVPDGHMPGQRRIVREDTVIANSAIMGDVNIGHDPVVVADRGYALILRRPTADRTELPNRVAIADLQAGGLTLVLLILRIITNRTK